MWVGGNFTKVWHESRTHNTIPRSKFEAYKANTDAYKAYTDVELKRLHDMLDVMQSQHMQSSQQFDVMPRSGNANCTLAFTLDYDKIQSQQVVQPTSIVSYYTYETSYLFIYLIY